MEDLIPIVLVTGFLGAGKTTFLNTLLGRGGAPGTAVLINEFGEIGLDQHLVAARPGPSVEMTNGCLCCNLLADLPSTLRGLLDRVARADIMPISRVLIETTGLAAPGPIVRTLIGDPWLSSAFSLGRVVTVVDAQHGEATLRAHAEALAQVRAADLMVVTKTDTLTGRNRANSGNLTACLSALNPTAQVCQDPASLDLDALFETPVGAATPAGRPAVSALHLHHPVPAEATILACPRSASVAQIEGCLDGLNRRFGATILRAKGLICDPENPPSPAVVQIVQGRREPTTRLAAWPTADRTGQVVVILRGVDAATIQTFWSELLQGA
jgi:G3E family GTPase